MENLTSQDHFRSLRDIIAEKTTPIVLWLGAGMSVPAKIPDWMGIRNQMIDNVRSEISYLEPKVKNSLNDQLNAASTHPSLWKAFSMLKEVAGKASYEQNIRKIFAKASSVEIPPNYLALMKLNPRGIITTNIDKLVSRAYIKINESTPVEFNGKDSNRFSFVLNEERNFILNLHGNHDDMASLVFTEDDFKSLEDAFYKNFLNTCLHSKTILFCGIRISDIAIKKYLSDLDVGCGFHFWLTTDTSSESRQFCSEHHILPIYYSEANDHKELSILIDELLKYKPQEPSANPVIWQENVNCILDIDSAEFSNSSPNLQRIALNQQASQLVKKADREAYQQYQFFRKKYERYIHNAWYVSTSPNDNELFDYRLISHIGGGAFGDVYIAEDKDHESVAIKILKIDVLKDDSRLQAFRRGVRSMKILSERKIEGMVPYFNSSEIPAFVVMSYIDGINLKEAIDHRHLKTIDLKIKVLLDIAEIMRNAHHLPERVLHRDLRPQNIMLSNFFNDSSDDWEVIVLDFDLAWYKDANEVSIDHSGSINGFLAPELLQNKEGLTRNALVDSFGMAMLIYFTMTGSTPYYNQHNDSNWATHVYQKFSTIRSREWISLPYILARLVIKCTDNEQSARLDMSQIYGILHSLQIANEDITKVRSCSLLAEEICARIVDALGIGKYIWDEKSNGAIIKQLSGAEITFIGDENCREIDVRIHWSNPGMFQYDTVNRKIKGNMDGIISTLDKLHFKEINSNIRVDQLEVVCKIKQSMAKDQIDGIVLGFKAICAKYLVF